MSRRPSSFRNKRLYGGPQRYEMPTAKPMPKETVEFEDIECVAESHMAICVAGLELAPLWIPKSVLDKEESEVIQKGDQGMLMIHEWWAKEKGLV